MMWIVQKNLLNDDAYWRLTVTMDELNIPWKPIDIVPFSDELDLPDGITNPCVFYGSTTLQRLVNARPNLVPGVWTSENFDYQMQIQKYGKHMLNHDAEIYPFNDVPEFEGVKFIRPVHDTKAFTGALIGGDEFRTWQNNVLGVAGWNNNPAYDGFMETWKSSVMTPQTPTLVASPKNVRFEYRIFVVNAEVITASLYHVNDRLVKRNADTDDNSLDPLIREYAQEQVDRWQPAEAFVMDIGVLEDDRGHYDFRIVEINSFNCSGFYECDVKKIVEAVELLTWE
jgi:ATP-grasp domain, R2K clade family 3